MNLRLLKIFRAVMVSQTTAGAARTLHISQPAVSNAIRQLEKELDFELFDRIGNRLAAREEAKVLMEESDAMVLYSRKLDDIAQDLKENRVGRLRISATPQLGHTVVPGAIHRFLKQRPNVKVVCDVIDSHKVIESVEASATDLGMAIALEPELCNSLKMVLITDISMVCILPAAHVLASKSTISPKELHNVPLIALDSMARLSPMVRSAFSAAGIPYRVSVEVRYSETACLMARAGAGVAVVDWFSASNFLRDPTVRIVPFRPKIMAHVWAIFASARAPSRLAYALLEEISSGIDMLRKSEASKKR